MTRYFNLRNFVLFSLYFVLFTAIGTVSHEMGHVVVAEALGYDTQLFWNSITYDHADVTSWHNFLIVLGGPVQTMGTGMLGLVFLYFRRRNDSTAEFEIIDWAAVFLSLFWLREVFNLLMSAGRELISPDGSYFGGDEAVMAGYLGLPSGSFSITFGITGLMIASYIVFKVIPKKYRLTFILSGLFGGITGFIIWMQIIGPLLLPDTGPLPG